MRKIKAELYVPMLLPFAFQETSREDVEIMICQWLELGSIQIPWEHDQMTVLIQRVGAKKSLPRAIQDARARLSRDCIMLRLSVVAPSDPLPVYDMKGNLEGRSEWANRACLENGLFERSADLVVLSNIASPGSVQLGEQSLFMEDSFCKSRDPILNDLGFAVEVANRNKWPELDKISLAVVFDWATRPNWSFDGMGGTPLGRALNAFSYTFSPGPDLFALSILHSLMGIEALYATGEEGIAHQICEKVQVFLGKAPGLSKQIKKMYNFRSRLVHGAMGFPANFRDLRALPEEERHRSEFSAASGLANAIILATFQKLAREGWKSLDFEYALRRSPYMGNVDS